MAQLKYYIIPAKHCSDAIKAYRKNKDEAEKEKRYLLKKYKANDIYRFEGVIEKLLFNEEPEEREGFRTKFDEKLDCWVQITRKNSIVGRQNQAYMNEVARLLYSAEWTLENELGIYGNMSCYYLGESAYFETEAFLTHEGNVLFYIPVREESDPPRLSGKDPKIHPKAIEITFSEADLLFKKQMDF